MGMVVVNEFVRLNTTEEGYKRRGVTAINSVKRIKDKCSWICHNDTDYCRENHVKLAKPHFNQIDPIYFGIIHSLQSTGAYRWANIVFLVILGPLFMYILLIKSIGIQTEINKIKKG